VFAQLTKLPNGLSDHELFPRLPTRMCDGLNWTIGDPIEKMDIFDEFGDDGNSYNDGAFVHDIVALNKYLDTVFLKGFEYKRIYVMVTIGRTVCADRIETLEILIPCTPRQILEGINTIFQRPATTEFVETLREFDNNHCCESVSVLELLEQGEDARLHHLQGGLVHFEGIHQIEDNVYRLSLGS
jgi:hypothetical protein